MARRDRRCEADAISDDRMVPALQRAERALMPTERGLRNKTANRVERRRDRARGRRTAGDLRARASLCSSRRCIAIWLTRSISRPVSALEKGMRAVAEGEFEHSPRRCRRSGATSSGGSPAASGDEPPARRARQAEGGVRLRRVARAEDADQRHPGLSCSSCRRACTAPLSPKQREILRTVEAQGRTLARLAAHLLDVSRFEAGGGRIEPRAVRSGHRARGARARVPRAGRAARGDVHVSRCGDRASRRGAVGRRPHQRGARQPARERLQVHARRHASS